MNQQDARHTRADACGMRAKCLIYMARRWPRPMRCPGNPIAPSLGTRIPGTRPGLPTRFLGCGTRGIGIGTDWIGKHGVRWRAMETRGPRRWPRALCPWFDTRHTMAHGIAARPLVAPMLLSYMQRRRPCLVRMGALAHALYRIGNGARLALCIVARRTVGGACWAFGFVLIALGLVRYDVLALHWHCRNVAAIDRTK